MKVVTQQVINLAQSLMAELDCPRSLMVSLLIKYGEWTQIAHLGLDPLHYSCAKSYMRAVSATSFLRKYVDMPVNEIGVDGSSRPIDLEARAKETWYWAEHECLKTNHRLAPYLYGHLSDDRVEPRIAKFLVDVKRNVASLLGGKPPMTWEGRFGPGATVTDRAGSTIPDKISSTPSFTPSALFYLVPWTATKWATASAELGRQPQSVRGNSFFTVPKDATKLRACAKEPSINGFYQLGLGRVLKDRLKQAGIDLTNGKEVHMQVACIASRDDSFATIDLTSASDTVAKDLVKLLLPPSWFQVLNDLRSLSTKIDGRVVYLEKFSSMGNGFTFELETLIFLAIAMTAMEHSGVDAYPGVNIWVFGDDIIVPRECGENVLAALKWCGFTPNRKKTFLSGPFRESCGGDFWLGEAVRPHFLEKDPDEPQKLISLANGINRLRFQVDLRDTLRRTWFRVLDEIPSSIRSCRGPQALGDIVIHDGPDQWKQRYRNQIGYLRVYRPARFKTVRWEGYAYSAQMAAALYGVQLRKLPRGRAANDPAMDYRGLTIRDGVAGYKVGWINFG